MRLDGSIAGRVRRALELTLPPRPRFHVFRVAACILPSRIGPGAFFSLASELAAGGNPWHAKQCWRVLHRMASADTRVAKGRVLAALDAGDIEEANQALDEAGHGTGVPPRLMIGFAGELIVRGYPGSAGQVLVRLAETRDCRRLLAQNPCIISSRLSDDIGTLGRALCAGTPDPASYRLSLARLCFAFRHPKISVQLYTGATASGNLDPLDRVAMLQALAQVGSVAEEACVEELRTLMRLVGDDPHELGALAQAALAAGEDSLAHEALDSALAALLDGSMYESEVREDCHAILDVLAALRGAAPELSPLLIERAPEAGSGIPKVFVCGFGWSGSGAIYDAIRGAEGFCEFEGSGVDPLINEDANSEVTFIQGEGGLGDLWKRAAEEGRITWPTLWQLFAQHVVGISPIGYAQYKSSAAARQHIRRYGARYTRPFRAFLEKYAELREEPRPGALHASLIEATESLCAMLVEETGARAILFNNAIFGRDAEMLEIFRSYKAAIVYRDPRDVYVDRRDNDLNHWRTPAQLAAYYAYGLRRYVDYRVGAPECGSRMREVSFERFVRDADFRAQVREWLMGEMPDEPTACHFDARSSIRNIAIYPGALSADESEQLHAASSECWKLDRLSRAAWGFGE